MALGRHLSGVDPNDPCFWSRTPKFFVIDRARLRSCSGVVAPYEVVFFFFYGSLLIIIIIWRSDAIQQ